MQTNSNIIRFVKASKLPVERNKQGTATKRTKHSWKRMDTKRENIYD